MYLPDEPRDAALVTAQTGITREASPLTKVWRHRGRHTPELDDVDTH